MNAPPARCRLSSSTASMCRTCPVSCISEVKVPNWFRAESDRQSQPLDLFVKASAAGRQTPCRIRKKVGMPRACQHPDPFATAPGGGMQHRNPCLVQEVLKPDSAHLVCAVDKPDLLRAQS